MQQLDTLVAMRQLRREWGDKDVALVPTMGNLHAGHLALVRQAKTLAQRVVVSIFVNPTQFGPHEDFARYPRTLMADLAACQQAGVDAVLTPTVDALYPEGLAPEQRFSLVPPSTLENQLCGANRPGHFAGVCLVVLKLLQWVQPQVAVFGEKDAQQLAIVRRMVQDFALPVAVVSHPVVRDPDGLALSSRNQYLTTPALRQAALTLPRVLKHMQQQYQANPQGGVRVNEAFALACCAAVEPSAKEVAVHWQYCQAVDAQTFMPLDVLQAGGRLCGALQVADVVRLIDTVCL